MRFFEFRLRYGYKCRRVACSHCQNYHYAGPWGACPEDSWENGGTRFCVSRADGTVVSSELSATQAWEAAHEHEQSRLVPILIARDAIAEHRFVHARAIADQLTPDLAEPLRREIALAETGAAKTAKEVGGAGTVATQR